MNLQPQQPDPGPAETPDAQIDALLDHALASDLDSADLEKRVLTLTDPKLNRLLDLALAPEATPAGLTDRVLAATEAASIDATYNRSVLAHIGYQTARYAAAAAVVFAAGLGIYVASQSQTDSTDDTVVAGTDSNDADQPAITYEQFADRYDPTNDLAIDREIEQLDSRISSVKQNIWEGDIDSFQEQLWSELSGEESL